MLLARALLAVAILPWLFAGVLPWGSGSPHVAAYAIVVAIVIHLRVIFYEERVLARQFPGDWARYSSTVSRWAPRLPPKD